METKIYAMHGIVGRKDSSKLCHRGMHDTRSFLWRLAQRSAPFVSIADAMAGRGDALTIDDATVAGRRAAEAARARGHAVTLFVNPYPVILRQPYYFHRLNALVDAARPGPIELEQAHFDLALVKERKLFREYMKCRLCRLGRESARIAAVQELEERLGVGSEQLPEYLGTLSSSDLAELHAAGVSLQNHGWMHPHYRSLDAADMRLEIGDARAWLTGQGYGAEGYFAVPFGDVLPDRRNRVGGHSLWLTLDDIFVQGPVGTKIWRKAPVWNRVPLPY